MTNFLCHKKIRPSAHNTQTGIPMVCVSLLRFAFIRRLRPVRHHHSECMSMPHIYNAFYACEACEAQQYALLCLAQVPHLHAKRNHNAQVLLRNFSPFAGRIRTNAPARL